MRILLTTLTSNYTETDLSLKYLYSVVAESPLDVELREFTMKQDRELIYGEILRGSYNLVVFSCYPENLTKIRRLGQNLARAGRGMKLLLTGPAVSYDSEAFLQENSWADFIIRGDGEKSFFQFCKELVRGRVDVANVDNLTYRQYDAVYSTADGPAIYLDKLPSPYTYLEVEPDKTVTYESMRGCPYRCAYRTSSRDTTVRELPLERVRRDIGYLMYKNIRQINFTDSVFNYNKERACEIWQSIIEKDNGSTTFRFKVSGELLSRGAFAVLSKARKGLFQFEIHVPTANPYTMKEIGWTISVLDLLENLRRLAELGTIEICVRMMAGLPEDDYKSFGLAFDRFYETHPDTMEIGFLKLLKGTELAEQAWRYGYVYEEEAPYEVISCDSMSSMDLLKLKMVETVLELYYNRGGFRRSLDFLEEDMNLTPFQLLERLADFYYAGGYHLASHKKEDLYRILYKFAMRQEAMHVGISMRAEHFLLMDLNDTLAPEVVGRFVEKGWDLK